MTWFLNKQTDIWMQGDNLKRRVREVREMMRTHEMLSPVDTGNNCKHGASRQFRNIA